MPVKSVQTLGWTRGGVAATIRLVTQEQRNDIAARIRAEMERQGLTSVRLARKADVSDKTVSRLINAQRDPRYDTLERVARALGMTEAELRGPPPPPLGLGGNGGPPDDDRLDRILGYVKDLDEQIRLLRAELAARDAEALARTDKERQSTPGSQRQQQQ